MSKTNLEIIALNAKLGDGCIYRQGQACGMSFTSTCLDYITYKRDMLIELRPTPMRTQRSGYEGKKAIYTFSVRCTEEARACYDMSYSEAIQILQKQDLILWLLDDGSLHRKHGTLHLYSNMLNKDESELLISKIYELYPVAMPKLRIDRKKDGRFFYYLYLPRILAEVIQVDMENFLISKSITSLLYKTTRKYTLNDHRKAKNGREPVLGPATLEPSRVGQ